MKSWSALGEAFAGWMKIVRGQAGWETHFAFTVPGLVTGLVIFAVFAFLSVLFASIGIGVPTLSGFIAVMLVQGLSVTALLISTYVTRMVSPSQAPLLQVLVPGIYALIFYLVMGTGLSLVGGPALLFLWLLMGFLFYRLGRVAGLWSAGIAAAYAGLTVVLLVGMPLSLYMLAGPTPTPP